jgi:N-acetylglucosamine kinase-like BadF-type ATPase
MKAWLGVDMGGTATRWVLRGADGAGIAAGSGAGANGLLFDDVARANYARALSGILPALRAAGGDRISAACLGVTGAGTGPAPDVVALTREVLGIDGPVRVMNDLVLAWHAAFPAGGPGYLVSAGTGSVGVGVDAQGRPTIVGGRGFIIDDGGSGTWIALEALNAVYRLIDVHGHPHGAERLAAALFDAMGGGDWDVVRAFVYGQDRGRIGTLARAVAQAAEAGDPLALDLLHRAGAEIARLAQALTRRFGPAPVGAVGGVLRLHPQVRASLEAALPGADLSYPEIDAARHAARMAYHQDEGHTP